MSHAASLRQSAPSLKALHLLRALLRQATYLPDAHARTYFRQYILNRFKAYQPKENATASYDVAAVQKYRHRSFRRRQVAIILERTRPLLRKGQKGLNFLRRANQGELPCLQKVLWFAYGRLGRRKYALLNELLKPDRVMNADVLPSSSNGVAPLQALYFSKKRYLQFFDAPKALPNKTHYSIEISERYTRLRTVIKTQNQKGRCINREIRSEALKTPINNVWERPMPIKRARNNVKRWYGQTLTRLLPPLPSAEWDDLNAMVHSQKRISLVKPRTPVLERQPGDQLTDYETQLRENILAGLALDKPSKADKPAGSQRPHNITVRFMRRLYSRIILLCCKLDYDEEQKRWKATWGEPSRATSPKPTVKAEVDASLFAGVDETGRIPRKVQPKKTEPEVMVPSRTRKGDLIHFPFYTEHLPLSHPMHQDLIAWKAQVAAAAKASAESDRGR